ncbi:MAG: shikimate dehydrogenase [Gammaproteobacteria bacterium]
MNKYVVIGNPIAHSLSPQIHIAFAKQSNIPLTFEKVLVDHYSDEGERYSAFRQTLNQLKASGIKGASVTLPFKQDAYDYATALSERAKRAGAVNTLCFRDEEIFGDNTDGVGLVNDLKRLNWEIENRSILILGAGGAVRGILPVLVDQNPKNIFILNRNQEKASQLAEQYEVVKVFDPKMHYDVVINATPLSLEGNLPETIQKVNVENKDCYDLAYSQNHLTAFCEWARKQGASAVSDGLGMLVEQAVEAFYLWHGVRPDLNLNSFNMKK